jgi:hypothetical protein
MSSHFTNDLRNDSGSYAKLRRIILHIPLTHMILIQKLYETAK